ncbi:hypothetical protein RIR_jg909.t1 [Rhizophagus irregularis DAOM 181602=DAOM 197198]|uniref:Uncharacterized protein n=1 Tax=Rhizophagus irregularis (strain DAOM 181602 / DAOM 197198 / MUCL 43194) TaxID=747089 RepID=U9U5P3_RHIID|nr:hypothetical protein RIR_jg909.t1 [Rhizophagus irregularis DAOM 181602=DAOM 197198]
MVRTPESEQISSESFGVEAMQSSTDAFATLKKELLRRDTETSEYNLLLINTQIESIRNGKVLIQQLNY